MSSSVDKPRVKFATEVAHEPYLQRDAFETLQQADINNIEMDETDSQLQNLFQACDTKGMSWYYF